MTFIICEAGINHCGSLDRALKMVEAAAECGADAVKFQSFTATELGYEPKLTEFLRGVELSKDDHFKLKMKADKCDIEFMSTPFDTKWCDFLVDEVGVERIKISSGKVKDRLFVDHVLDRGLPVIASNGMVSSGYFNNAFFEYDMVNAFTALYCVSEYPTPLYKVDFVKMFEDMSESNRNLVEELKAGRQQNFELLGLVQEMVKSQKDSTSIQERILQTSM